MNCKTNHGITPVEGKGKPTDLANHPNHRWVKSNSSWHDRRRRLLFRSTGLVYLIPLDLLGSLAIRRRGRRHIPWQETIFFVSSVSQPIRVPSLVWDYTPNRIISGDHENWDMSLQIIDSHLFYYNKSTPTNVTRMRGLAELSPTYGS